MHLLVAVPGALIAIGLNIDSAQVANRVEQPTVRAAVAASAVQTGHPASAGAIAARVPQMQLPVGWGVATLRAAWSG